MNKNRIIYLALLIGATVLVSFYGGTISYALFYMCLSVPVVAFIYNIYVYLRLQFYQQTPSRIVEKGKVLPYEVQFKNLDFIPFTHIKVKFYDEQCQVEANDEFTEYYLLPGDEKKLQTTLRCFYRGEYCVGVKEIEIMDFLYLFKMTYPVMWSLKLTVLPTVIKLGQLGILLNDEDPKTNDYGKAENMLLESETRKYQPGDYPRQIHWKAVARQRELLTRKVSKEIKRDNIILMDLQSVEEKEYTKLAIEDKIIEIVLAMGYYLQAQGTGAKICLYDDSLREYPITSPETFGTFYTVSSEVHFSAQKSFGEVLEAYMLQHPKLDYYLLVTHEISEELLLSASKAVTYGQKVMILLVRTDCQEAEQSYMNRLEMMGICVICIKPQDDLNKVLGG